MQHRATIGHLIKGYVPMVEVNLVKPSDGSKLWHLENNLPDVGLCATFIDFGNPSQLGQSISLAPFIEIPLNVKVRASRPIFRISWGLAYLTRRFDINENHKNIAIGSLNIASQVAQWDLIDEYHFVVHPVIAGKGPRLFETDRNFALRLVGAKTFRSGVIALHYEK